MTKVSFVFTGVVVALMLGGSFAWIRQDSSVDAPSSTLARIRPTKSPAAAPAKHREVEPERVNRWRPVALAPVVDHEGPAPTGADRIGDSEARGESALMAELGSLGSTDPERSLALAREGNARFPTTSAAPERARIVVKSLVGLRRFHEARDEARRMLAAYPRTPEALDVERHLLVYPLDQPSREQMQAEMQGDPAQ